jgi:hypothetical protein
LVEVDIARGIARKRITPPAVEQGLEKQFVLQLGIAHFEAP